MITIDISHTIYTSEGAKDLLVNKTVKEGALVQLSGLSGIGKHDPIPHFGRTYKTRSRLLSCR